MGLSLPRPTFCRHPGAGRGPVEGRFRISPAGRNWTPAFAGVALIMMAVLSTPATAQTQADLTAQAGADWKRADVAMNVQYRATMAFMKTMDGHAGAQTGPSYSQALLASQRAWLTFRDAQCVIQGYGYRGGSAEPMERLACRATLTRERTKQLKDLVWQR